MAATAAFRAPSRAYPPGFSTTGLLAHTRCRHQRGDLPDESAAAANSTRHASQPAAAASMASLNRGRHRIFAAVLQRSRASRQRSGDSQLPSDQAGRVHPPAGGRRRCRVALVGDHHDTSARPACHARSSADAGGRSRAACSHQANSVCARCQPTPWQNYQRPPLQPPSGSSSQRFAVSVTQARR